MIRGLEVTFVQVAQIQSQKRCGQNLQWRTVTVDVIVGEQQYPSPAK